MKKENIEPKNSNRNLSIFLLIVLVIALFAVFGDKGFVEVYRLSSDKDSIVESNRVLSEENSKIKGKISRLETDDKYIAEIAKKDLGMVATDEVIYIIDNSK